MWPLDASHAVAAPATRQKPREIHAPDVDTALPGRAERRRADRGVEPGTRACSILQQAKGVNQQERTITLRAPESTLNAFNSTTRTLLAGKARVLDMRIDQVAHMRAIAIRAHSFRRPFNAFNVYAGRYNSSKPEPKSGAANYFRRGWLSLKADPLAILGAFCWPRARSAQVRCSLTDGGVRRRVT